MTSKIENINIKANINIEYKIKGILIFFPYLSMFVGIIKNILYEFFNCLKTILDAITKI